MGIIIIKHIRAMAFVVSRISFNPCANIQPSIAMDVPMGYANSSKYLV